MKKYSIILMLILTLPLISSLTTAQNDYQYSVVYKKSVDSKNNLTHIVELFTSDNCENCHLTEKEYLNQFNDDYESSMWLTWHKMNDEPSIDINLRMEQMNINTTPEITVNLQKTNSNNLSGIEWKNNIMNQIDSNVQNTIIDLPLEINMLDTNADTLIDSIMVSSMITPHTNLSNDTTLNVMLVEWRAIISQNNQQLLKRNLVKEWIPKKDFSVEENSSTNWSFVFTPDYLDAAGIELDQEINERYGLILFVSGNERNEENSNSEILGANLAKLPNAAQSTTNEQSLSWIFLILLLLLALILIVISERKREYGIPKLSGKIVERNERGISAILNIKAGNLPLEIKSIEVSEIWSLKTKNLSKMLSINEEIKLNLSIRKRKKDLEEGNSYENPTLQVSIEIEDLGGWVLNLPLKD